MASKIKVDQIEGQSGTTVTLPSGQTLDLSSGSVTLPNNAVDLASAKVTGTLGSSNLPTIPVTKGGTGLTSLGSAGQVVKVNSGGNALEFGAAGSSGKILAYYHDSDYSNRTTTSTSYDLHGSTISIQLTPASSASKFYLIMTFQGGNNMSARRSLYKFHRDGSALNDSNMEHEFIDGYSNENPSAMSFIDSPNTASQITYDVRWRANGSSDTGKLNMQTLMIFELGA